MRRYVYDTIPAVTGRWVRLRDTGAEVTLCVKEISSDAIDGTRETETTVGDFETVHAVLEQLGLTARSYQENRRDSWLLDGVRLEIDTWPRYWSRISSASSHVSTTTCERVPLVIQQNA